MTFDPTTFNRLRLNRRRALGAIGAMGMASAPGALFAQEAWPTRPVRLVIPVVAGNGSDVALRALAKELSALSGQPFIIDNKPGGNAVIAAQAVMAAPADGYTIFSGSNASHAANVPTLKNPGFDPVADFIPVALSVRARPVLCVGMDSPYKTIEQLVAAGKRDPKALTAGTGSTAHQMLVGLFARGAGTTVTIIPYKGTPQAVADTVGGQVSFVIADAPSLVPMIQGGKLRPLVVTGDKRLPLLEDVPTVNEKGYGTIALHSWSGFFVHAKTPPSMVQRIAQLTERAVKTEGMRQFASQARLELDYMGPAAFAAFQKEQIIVYREAMVVAGLEPQ